MLVPVGKRWHVSALEVYLSTGTYTLNAVILGSKYGGTCTINQQAAGVTNIITGILSPFQLEGGDAIYGNVLAFTGAGDAVINAWIQEEDMP